MSSSQLSFGDGLRSISISHKELMEKMITLNLWVDIKPNLKMIAHDKLRHATVQIVEDSGHPIVQINGKAFSTPAVNGICSTYKVDYIVGTSQYGVFKFINIDFEYLEKLVTGDDCIYTRLDVASFKISW